MLDLQKIKNQKIMVIGDVMLDAYVFGNVDRISPEAPVPVVAQVHKEYRLGGAANVALNIKAMGATPLIVGVVGDDEDAQLLKTELEKKNISATYLVDEAHRPTTVKTRIIGNNHQLLRVDKEVTRNILEATENHLYEKIAAAISTVQALIFEDYEKGLLSAPFIQKITALCIAHQVPVIVDPKKHNFMAYEHATFFKPNLKEIREGLKLNQLETLEEIKAAAMQLLEKMHLQYVMVTLSERGVIICDKNNSYHIPAHLRKIADVSGAGDTVVSIAALCLAQQLPPQAIAQLSNLAGGLVCEEIGVVPLNPEKFKSEIDKLL